MTKNSKYASNEFPSGKTHTRLSLIIRLAGTVHLNIRAQLKSKKGQSIKIISSRCSSGNMLLSPLLLKSLFPRDKFTGGEVLERGNCARDGDEAEDFCSCDRIPL